MGKDAGKTNAAGSGKGAVLKIPWAKRILVVLVPAAILLTLEAMIGFRRVWIFCNANPGGVQAVATSVLVLCTITYILVVWRQGRTMHRQLRAMQEQAQARVDQAVNTIVIEILTNDAMARTDTPAVLHDGGSQLLWSLAEYGTLTATIAVISQAYICARTYNQARMMGKGDKHTSVWEKAKAMAKAAKHAARHDPALRSLRLLDTDDGATTNP